jgi:hypothetical protein
MRDFNDVEMRRMQRGLCPACGQKHDKYIPGPRGGAAMNIEMPCGARMNIMDPDTYGFPPPFLVGQMLSDIPPPPLTVGEQVRSQFWRFFHRR